MASSSPSTPRDRQPPRCVTPPRWACPQKTIRSGKIDTSVLPPPWSLDTASNNATRLLDELSEEYLDTSKKT